MLVFGFSLQFSFLLKHPILQELWQSLLEEVKFFSIAQVMNSFIVNQWNHVNHWLLVDTKQQKFCSCKIFQTYSIIYAKGTMNKAEIIVKKKY